MISKHAVRCLDDSKESTFMRWFESKMEELERTNFVVVVKTSQTKAIGRADSPTHPKRRPTELDLKIEAGVAKYPHLTPYQLGTKIGVWPSTIELFLKRNT